MNGLPNIPKNGLLTFSTLLIETLAFLPTHTPLSSFMLDGLGAYPAVSLSTALWELCTGSTIGVCSVVGVTVACCCLVACTGSTDCLG